MCKPLNYEDKDHKALLRRILSGNVVLFTGSGFSIGAIGNMRDEETGEKIPIPNVGQLKTILANKVLDSVEEQLPLKEICEDCQEDNCERYAQVMREVFRVSKVEDFHHLYAKIDWKSIYTTNVDNVIEYIYDGTNKKIYNVYSEKPIYIERGALVLYKLHGDAIYAPERITFSTSDYRVNAAKRNDYRFENLTAALKTDNFLFIGTSLNDEWDFDIKCEQADVYSVSNKAYFVLKEYDERLIKRLRRRFKNAVMIQETAETFILKVMQYLQDNPVQGVAYSYEKWNFNLIRECNFKVDNYLKPDLYLGAEPTWEDIFSNHDVVWEKTQRTINYLIANYRVPCTLIVGKPVSGKSTMLYRIGRDLCNDSKVLEYIGDNFLEDIRSLMNNQRNSGQNCIVLLDDANWILGRIGQVIDIFQETNIRLIATVRQSEFDKRQYLFDEVLLRNIYIVEDINDLTKIDIELYLEKLFEKSFLGNYSKKFNDDKEKAIDDLYKEIREKKDDPLLKLAYKMKYGSVLDKRIDDISKHVAINENFNLKRFAVLLYLLDVIGDTGLKLSLFLDLFPMNEKQLKEFISESQETLISNINRISWEKSSYNKITIHSRFSEIVKKVIPKISYEELETIVEDIFIRLDNVYHFKCRQSNSYLNYVLYTLLRSQNICELFRDKYKQINWTYINKMYENIHEYYEDYHLYWLHRGISEIKMKKYPAATIHLQQARIVRNVYSYEIEHTFALLYFEMGMNSKNLMYSERKELLRKALEIIKLQIGRKENDAFSIHSFVVKTIQFYQRINEVIPEYLIKEILQYYYLARKMFSLNKSRIRRNMLMCIYKYLIDHDKLYEYSLSVEQEELEYINRRIGDEDINYDVIDLL